ncbi:MAG: hypothetical protein LAT77_07480 [Aliidiomarina sp.]|uniref:hypothetical protein n=1 Tax=Aliidiomarina sp. TaxID=1872439 RepID=UPI0025BACECE|nr:hypothetical protein [Aliidiomarina sp.]MCH8501735.1 hypothetical protein [Aliidiomarina sp.]
MQDLDRKAHWQRVYDNKDESEVSWFQTEPTVSLELIANCQLTANQPVIDVGGGASVLVDRMLALGYRNLTVLDISSAALAKTQARLAVQKSAAVCRLCSMMPQRSRLSSVTNLN